MIVAVDMNRNPLIHLRHSMESDPQIRSAVDDAYVFVFAYLPAIG
jgi:hypothetical protein